MDKTIKILLSALIILLVVIGIGIICYRLYKEKHNTKKFKTLTKHQVIDETRNGLFNMSYSPDKNDKTTYFHGYGRTKKKHNKLFKKVIDSSGRVISQPKEVALPSEVADTSVGEVKGFILNNQFHVYTNFWGDKRDLDIFPTCATQQSRDLYFKSSYRNYLWNTETSKVVPLFYDILPGTGLTHKNFLFFDDRHLVITSVSPHSIYELDIDSGYIKPHSITTNSIRDHFDTEHEVYLSGGPVRIENEGCYLVAGHIAKGGWGGLRMTFFYTFRDTYPFDIISVSEPVSFGFSNSLEYCNQMFKYEGFLYLSIGVNDEYSVLIQIDTETILLLMKDCRKQGELPLCFTSNHVEEGERVVADQFTFPDSCVLEFGGGSGAVSTVIQGKLNIPTDHVVIQPDHDGSMFGGLAQLRKNRDSCGHNYHIVDHILKSGEGTNLLKLVSKPFDTLVVDCEGCLHTEFEKNPDLFKFVTMIQVERDDGNKYDSLFSELGMRKVHIGNGCDGDCTTEVWTRENIHSTCQLKSPMENYRLGDMVLHSQKSGKEWHIKTYPKSIASEYLSKTDDKNQIDILVDIIMKRTHNKDIERGIAIHLRVGDVIELSDSSVIDIVTKPTYRYPGKDWSQYTPCWTNIKECLRKISTDVKVITIFAASHGRNPHNENPNDYKPSDDFSKSCMYISLIEQRLKNLGYNVIRKLGGNPDEDFLQMTTSPYFIQSGGGYSELISKVRGKLGLSSYKAFVS